MPKPRKNPPVSQEIPTTSAESILAQLGGAEAIVVHVFRRVGGGKLAFLRQYGQDEADNIQERILSDHGPGFYQVQVKQGTRIMGSRQVTCGDVSELPTPTPVAAGNVAGVAVQPKKSGGGSLVKLLMTQLLAQQQSMTQIMCTMIASASKTATDPALVEVIKLVGKQGGGGGGVADTLELIRAAQELLPGGDGGRADREANAAAVVQTIAGTAERVLPPILELIMRRRDASGVPPTTAAAGELPAAAPQNSSLTGAAQAAGASTPPPQAAKRMPFPGAQAIAAELAQLGALFPADAEITADGMDADALTRIAQEAIERIEHHGGDVDDVLDWYPPVDGGLAEVLIEYEPALKRAGKLLVAIDTAIRNVREWEAENETGDTDQPA